MGKRPTPAEVERAKRYAEHEGWLIDGEWQFDRLNREFMLRETIASVSLSHAEDCRCLTCRASLGDDAAFAELVAKLDALEGKEQT